MRVLAVGAAIIVVLAAALITEAVFDSALGGWVALGIVAGYALLRFIGWLPGIDLGDFGGDGGD